MDIVGRMSSGDVHGNAIVYAYPCGDFDILCASDKQFLSDGWEAVDDDRRRNGPPPSARVAGVKSSGEDMKRSARRAKANMRRLALSNNFQWFVTLTLDEKRIDRYDASMIQKALSVWCNNMVQRHGMRYILVPERHKDGAFHFHGLLSGAGIEAVDSGTLKLPGIKKPRRPADAAQRAAWLAEGAQVVYNLPQWALGFSTAIPLYGEYGAAVAYVCKYIGKQEGERPLGRWYYSGGALRKPEKQVCTLDYRQIREDFKGVEFTIPGTALFVAHVRGENVQKEE